MSAKYSADTYAVSGGVGGAGGGSGGGSFAAASFRGGARGSGGEALRARDALLKTDPKIIKAQRAHEEFRKSSPGGSYGACTKCASHLIEYTGADNLWICLACGHGPALHRIVDVRSSDHPAHTHTPSFDEVFDHHPLGPEASRAIREQAAMQPSLRPSEPSARFQPGAEKFRSLAERDQLARRLFETDPAVKAHVMRMSEAEPRTCTGHGFSEPAYKEGVRRAWAAGVSLRYPREHAWRQSAEKRAAEMLSDTSAFEEE